MTLTLSSSQPSKTIAFGAVSRRFHPISRSSRRPYSLSISSHIIAKNRSNWRRSFFIKAIDVSQPYYQEIQKLERSNKTNKLKIAIIGFGNFGRFLAKTLVRQGHTVSATSRSNYSDFATKLGVSFYSDPQDLFKNQPEVILICTSILSTESVLRKLHLTMLKPSTLFVDVLSVKEMPKDLLLQILPPEFDILCTHPMFGPESGINEWTDLPFVYDKVRIGNEETRINRCENFLNIFAQEGCCMVEMSCADHDKYAAGTQFITHFIGRTLGKIHLVSTPINTQGYAKLLILRDCTCGDSFELFYGMFVHNKNALEQLERLAMAVESIKNELIGLLGKEMRPETKETPTDTMR